MLYRDAELVILILSSLETTFCICHNMVDWPGLESLDLNQKKKEKKGKEKRNSQHFFDKTKNMHFHPASRYECTVYFNKHRLRQSVKTKKYD